VGLGARGLAGVRLWVCDAHDGLWQAIAQVLGCPGQRCSGHFLCDLLGHIAKASSR
jgi:putative transposase